MSATTTRVCVECHEPPADGQGLERHRCHRCYMHHYNRGTHIDLPRPTSARQDVADDYVVLRAEGHSRRQIAERLGMTKSALEQALKRAALAGDTRIDYQPRRAA